MEDLFNKWLYEACEIKASKTRKDPHDIYQTVNLTEAKLAFISRETPDEYSKDI